MTQRALFQARCAVDFSPQKIALEAIVDRPSVQVDTGMGH